MPTLPTCKTCGAPLPDPSPGCECPACLVRLTLETTPPDRPSSAPLSPAEVQRHFADLEILQLIGRGGMGVVYKARQTALGRLVAVKLLAPERVADPAFAERFAREARTLARLNHPHIVAVHDVGQAGGSVFILMEYVEGDSLRNRLQAGRLTPPDALRLVPQLCDAIQYAHDHGVVHRDIKPENVLIDRAGRVKIADFGLAKSEDERDFTLTGSGERMGTARYMAPEQWRDTATVDHRADIYALGVMFYEMLTGDLPTPQCQPPSARAGTDPRLDRVVARSLSEQPAQRYQQVAELKSDVERIATTVRRRTLVWLAVVVLLVGVVAAAQLWPRSESRLPTDRPPDPPPAPTPAPPTRQPTPTDVLTSPEWEWTPPENLGTGVNTEHNEVTPYITADGLTLLFQSTRPGGEGAADLWECWRTAVDQPFGDPVNLGPKVNSPDDEDAPCLSADGLTLVFASKRGGRVDTDIWMTRRAAPDAPWGEPTNLGPDVNSDSYEFRPWLSRDGRRLTFSSLRQGEGVWVSRRASPADPFGKAVPFSRDFNRLWVAGLSFSADDRTILCSRLNRVYPGDVLWLSRFDTEDDPFRNLTSFGPVVNTNAVDTAPVASADGRVVYFQSDRPGGHGGYDIWQTRRVPKRPGGSP